METITNVVNTASKAIFGEQTTAGNETAGNEPVSGLQGKGTAADPFDQGNAPNPTDPVGKTDLSEPVETNKSVPENERVTLPKPKTTEHSDLEAIKQSDLKATEQSDLKPSDLKATEPSDLKATEPSDLKATEPSDLKATEPSDLKATSPSVATPTPKTETENVTTDPLKSSIATETHKSAPVTEAAPTKPDELSKPTALPDRTAPAAGGHPKPLEDTEGTGVTGNSFQKFVPKGGDVIPSESSENPGAITPSDVPSQKQQGADRPKEAPEGEELSAVKAKKDDAEEVQSKRDPNDHSGEPMQFHGGNEKLPETQAERRESKFGNPGGQEHGKEPKGTGEQYVKSTGLQADGGNFDASKPGAGKEADRLLEDKGIHRDAKGNMDGTPEAPEGTEKEKVSKLDKLKEKLHIGHKEK